MESAGGLVYTLVWALALGFASAIGYSAILAPVPESTTSFDTDVSVLEPVAIHGAILRIEADRTKLPALRAFDLQGKPLSAIPIQIPDAATVKIYAATRGADGSYAVSGYSVADDGRIAMFIDLISQTASSSSPGTLIRTDPFAPRRLAIAADGSIWASGNVYLHRNAPAGSDPSGGILRHYAASGRLLNSAFPQADPDNVGRAVTGAIAASPDRVGWLSSGLYTKATGWPGAYIEFNSNGDQQQYPLPALRQSEGRAVVALAITDSNHVFATGFDSSDHVRVFQLDRTHKSWSPVALPGFPETEPFLLGATGNVVAVWDSSNRQVHFFNTNSGN